MVVSGSLSSTPSIEDATAGSPRPYIAPVAFHTQRERAKPYHLPQKLPSPRPARTVGSLDEEVQKLSVSDTPALCSFSPLSAAVGLSVEAADEDEDSDLTPTKARIEDMRRGLSGNSFPLSTTDLSRPSLTPAWQSGSPVDGSDLDSINPQQPDQPSLAGLPETAVLQVSMPISPEDSPAKATGFLMPVSPIPRSYTRNPFLRRSRSPDFVPSEEMDAEVDAALSASITRPKWLTEQFEDRH